ncbi:Sodium/calcium exchanger protein-domain-containing protein [Cladorrhinum sp. PSN259]|nr:Sodium/calcium exchanger protein-domain-containing protein [Cladorrhinum sp. PSN259]
MYKHCCVPCVKAPTEHVQKKNIGLRFLAAVNEILLSSYTNVLLVFVPVGIAVHLVHAPAGVIFSMNAVAIIPLAGLLSHATESAANRMGDTIGALINVTFGNAVELIIFVIALIKNKIRIVQASLVGSILANVLLILGMCFLLGGLKFEQQAYNNKITHTSASLLALSVVSLLIPTVFHASFSKESTADDKVLQLSRGTSIILLVVYLLYLVFQLKTHTGLYESTSQHIIDEVSRPGPAAQIFHGSSSHLASSEADVEEDERVSRRAIRGRRPLRGRNTDKSEEGTGTTSTSELEHVSPVRVGTSAPGSDDGSVRDPVTTKNSVSTPPQTVPNFDLEAQQQITPTPPPSQSPARPLSFSQALACRDLPFSEPNPPSGNLPSRRSSAASVPTPQHPTAQLPSTDEPCIQLPSKQHMSPKTASILLLLSTTLVSLHAEFMISSIDALLASDKGLSEAFIGLILLPIVGNAAEHVTAVSVALKNKMDLAIGVAVGSSIQIALFVTPLVTILGWVMGKDMSLFFTLFETVCVVVSAFIVSFLVLDGRSNYLEGALLCAGYVIIAVAAFFYPDPQAASGLGSGIEIGGGT